MSQTTTGEFRRRFPKWDNASKVTVSCKKENDTDATRIAQYCDDQIHSCRKMNKSGVSLEKDQDGLCLTINNVTYDSWSCEAVSYIDDNEQKGNFTVDFSNQPTNTSSNQETDNNSLSQEHINTSPGPDTSPISDQWPIAGVIIVSITSIVLIALIVWCIYKKVKSSRNTTSNLNGENQQYMEMVEMGENEPMQDRVMLENEVLGENGELEENGETLALGQNGQQERRQAKKIIAPCATSSMI